MTVSTTHPEYDKHSEEWQLCRDAAEGDPAIKRGRTKYLPHEKALENPAWYNGFLGRAYFIGATSRTINALIGMVYRKPAQQDLPQGIESLLENIDGAGNSIMQVGKDALSGLLQTRRHLFLVDYPQAPEGASKETYAALGLRPMVKPYIAEALINWKHETIGGRTILTLAVLRENENTAEDEFGHDYKLRYRVLRLRPEGYSQQIYDDKEQATGDEFFPRIAGGSTLDFIPLFGVRELETPPIYEVARANIAHYQAVARVKESSEVMGEPFLHIDIGETSPEEWKKSNSAEIKLGARSGILTKNGAVEIVQALPNTIASEEVNRETDNLVMMGAQLITKGQKPKTAEEVRTNAAAESSVLDMLTNDLSEDLEAALEAMALFIGENPDAIEYKLNTDFFDNGLSAQDLTAMIAAKQSGILAPVDVRNAIRSGRIMLDAQRTDETIAQDVADDFLNAAEPQMQ